MFKWLRGWFGRNFLDEDKHIYGVVRFHNGKYGVARWERGLSPFMQYLSLPISTGPKHWWSEGAEAHIHKCMVDDVQVAMEALGKIKNPPKPVPFATPIGVPEETKNV